MSASSSVNGMFGVGSMIAVTFRLTLSTNSSASSWFLNTHARPYSPVAATLTSPPGVSASTPPPSISAPGAPNSRPALALPLIVIFTLPSARTSLIASTPPPISTKNTFTAPASPRSDEFVTHMYGGGLPPAPASDSVQVSPAMRQISSAVRVAICWWIPVATIAAMISATSSSIPMKSAPVWPASDRSGGRRRSRMART
jgi:hypothetical protein